MKPAPSLLINGVYYIGLLSHLFTIDPDFLGFQVSHDTFHNLLEKKWLNLLEMFTLFSGAKQQQQQQQQQQRQQQQQQQQHGKVT